MLSTLQLYAILEEERERVLERFSKVDKKHLYYVDKEGTWSPEMIFRHMLMSNQWLLDKLPGGEKLEAPEIALSPGVFPTDEVSLDQIRDAFLFYSDIIKQRLSFLKHEEEKEFIDTFRGKKTRQAVMRGFIYHELRHLGQITWLFKRSTGWSDKKIYEN